MGEAGGREEADEGQGDKGQAEEEEEQELSAPMDQRNSFRLRSAYCNQIYRFRTQYSSTCFVEFISRSAHCTISGLHRLIVPDLFSILFMNFSSTTLAVGLSFL